MSLKDFHESIREMHDLVRTRGEGGFWHCAPILKKIAAESSYIYALNHILSGIQDGGLLRGLIVTGGKFIILAIEGPLTLVLTRGSQRRKTLRLTPGHSLETILSPSKVNAHKYIIPSDINLEVFDSNATLEKGETELGDMGTVFYRNGLREILDLEFPQSEQKPTLRLTYGPLGNYEWEFDPLSLKAISVAMNSPVFSNTHAICELLADIGSKESINFLLPLTAHHVHTLRWQAVKAIAQIEPKMGINLIKQSVTDPHPHIRKAAVETIRIRNSV